MRAPLAEAPVPRLDSVHLHHVMNRILPRFSIQIPRESFTFSGVWLKDRPHNFPDSLHMLFR